ncbi:MAG: hypothetical protein HGA37_09315 [Lentimicrobium sp.]|nr:hypothetical protein [Lentimicrobium sp.]
MRICTALSKVSFFLILIITITSGCKKNDADLVPSYLYIDQIGLTTSYDQGTSSQRITDAWVYVDETLIGAFELPATVPILREGLQNITIRPGIKLNGIANTRSIYPFYSDIKRSITLVKDSVINVSDVVTTYKTNVTFPWLEDFNFSGVTLDTTSKSTVGIDKINNPELVFSQPGELNSYSAFITMTENTDVFEAVSTEKFDFPGNGASIFLEMNYKINHELVVGVFYTASGIRVQRPLLILNKTDDWNKVYVNLTVPKYDTPSAYDFQIFFGTQKEGTEDALIYLDNLKLVHF